MEAEILHIEKSLKGAFSSASNIFVDPVHKVCEVTISIDDFQGEHIGNLYEDGITFSMVDYCDVYPFKYVFNYEIKGQAL